MSATTFRSGKPTLCIQCGQCSFVCPHSVIRAKYYDEETAREARPRVQVRADQRARLPRSALHPAVLCRGLHGLRPVHRGLPGRRPVRPRPQGDQPARQGAAHRSRAHQHQLLRELADQRPRPRRFRQRARRAIPAAAVRVLRRVRGLRRDAVHQTAVATLRRPAADRQRHGLLVDLRRQPAGDALDEESRGPRSGLVELAVRGQRRVRARLPPRRRRARSSSPTHCCASWRRSWARIWSMRSSTAPQIAGIGDSRAARAGRGR